jgi:uncharacterized protein YdhG (YjbR/CyaY superfamily)
MKKSSKKPPKNIDDYIAGYPKDVQAVLEKIRTTIRRVAPQAEESISYGIPTFKLNGPLIYFAAFKSHIGVYPVTPDIKKKLDLSGYAGGKGTIKLPLDEPIPYTLIGRIVKLKVQLRKA